MSDDDDDGASLDEEKKSDDDASSSDYDSDSNTSEVQKEVSLTLSVCLHKIAGNENNCQNCTCD